MSIMAVSCNPAITGFRERVEIVSTAPVSPPISAPAAAPIYIRSRIARMSPVKLSVPHVHSLSGHFTDSLVFRKFEHLTGFLFVGLPADRDRTFARDLDMFGRFVDCSIE